MREIHDNARDDRVGDDGARHGDLVMVTLWMWWFCRAPIHGDSLEVVLAAVLADKKQQQKKNSDGDDGVRSSRW